MTVTGAGTDVQRGGGEDLLTVESVSKSFRGLHAVQDASFSVADGSITALIGPNGAGKTTMFDLVSGFQQADSGTVRLSGQRISDRPADEVSRLGVTRTFQLTRTFSAMSVIDNVLVGATHHPGERIRSLVARPGRVRRHERAARERANELLESFSLTPKASDLAGSLSGGQRKLLEMARALMTRPRLLLLDEPLAGVNPTLGARLLEYMVSIRDQHGVTVLFVEHDLEAVMRYADAIVVMAAGTVIASGPPEMVRRDPRVLDAYLGLGKPSGDVAGGMFGE